jgi:hypothetical protein
MKEHELLKILDSTFHDVEFDIFTDTEGLVRVNFVVDIEEGKRMSTNKTIKIYIEGGCLLDVTDLPPGYDYELIDYDNKEE